MRALIVVDMQNDFIDGSLGTKEAVSIVPKVKKKIEEAQAEGREVIFTRDTHYDDYLETNEGKHLPVVHCVEESRGWEISEELDASASTIINKNTFGYTGWTDFDFEEVELVGLCTDICVVSNALIIKALFPEIKVSVDASCCAGVTPEAHEAALTTMRSCQIEIVNG
ncbi:MAG: cysteine hydrolase [Lachnospiraceae bacterium]|nr:cysteine hydrolase [Lachnospiraceae bacterium]